MPLRSKRSLVSDRHLVARAAAGDRDAFVALVRRHDDRLRSLAAKLLAGDRHAMDDVMQDAYVHAYRALPRFRQEAQFGTWLYRIVYNACVDELRRARRRPAPFDPTDAGWDAPTTAAGPDAVAGAADTTTRALAELSADQRAVVVLVDGEGFDHGTAARILGVAPGTVASRLSRGRARIRLAVGEDLA